MKTVLFKLDEFCGRNKIEYTVTGTFALELLGVPSGYSPRDIDIKVFHLTEEQAQKLSELQFLSGLKNEKYEKTTCFSFLIDGIKINAIVSSETNYDSICSQSVTLTLVDKNTPVLRSINVMKVKQALAAKMKLNRDKDKAYMLNLIHNIVK